MDQSLEPDQRFSLLLSQMDTDMRRQDASAAETTQQSFTASENGKNEMDQTIEGILQSREKTHGLYSVQSAMSQRLKSLIRTSPNWEDMPEYMQESLEIIEQKIARILSGNAYEPDHWLDIIGYAALVVRELDQVNQETRSQNV